METLFSPWRSKYIESFKSESIEDESCFICAAANKPDQDAERLVIARRKHCFALLNWYPYNAGHILVCQYRHTGVFSELSSEEMSEIMDTLQECSLALENNYKCHGFNLGANIGRSAGAGVPGHIHFHIVPRWKGDTNFMPVFAEVKVVSQELEEMQRTLSKALKR